MIWNMDWPVRAGVMATARRDPGLLVWLSKGQIRRHGQAVRGLRLMWKYGQNDTSRPISYDFGLFGFIL